MLSEQAQRLAGILAFTIVYWICEPIPVAVTAMLGPMLCVLAGVVEPKGADDATKLVLRSIASPIIFLFIGTFILEHPTRPRPM